MADLTLLIPAAGASSRMRGTDKLLETVASQPLLRRQAQIALATGLPVLVTLRPGDDARRAALAGLGLTVLTVADAATGLSASIRTGAASVRTALMILPADMPDLTLADLSRVIAAFRQNPDDIHRGASGDRPGHPVILPARLLPEIARLTGDEGARGLIEAQGTRLVDLPGEHALTDLDTPEDWQSWRRRNS